MRYREIISPGPPSLTETAGTERMRVHNTHSLLTTLRTYSQRSHTRKPIGLWWAFQNDWHDFVRTKPVNSGLRGKTVGNYDYEVMLQEGFRLLTLDTADALLAFTVEFGQPTPHAAGGFFWQSGDKLKYDPAQDNEMPRNCRVQCINWPAVAAVYDGVEVPNLKELRPFRPRFDWLDIDWAVSSGCAWNTSKVTIRLLE